jgi:hypothetical protein
VWKNQQFLVDPVNNGCKEKFQILYLSGRDGGWQALLSSYNLTEIIKDKWITQNWEHAKPSSTSICQEGSTPRD